jgi:hypothetical protein
MVGHKTEAIYRRYAIADERRLREGADMPIEDRSVADVGEGMETRMVGWDGIEPPTPGFSVLGVDRLHRPHFQRLAPSRGRADRCETLRPVARCRTA